MVYYYCFVIYLLVLLSSKIYTYQVKTEKDAVAYLTYYGYVDPKEMPVGFTLKDCNKKLKDFQKLARVDVTGVLDPSTMKAMNSPRCGCPDFIHLSFKNTASSDDHRRHTHKHYHNHHYHNHSRSHRHYGTHLHSDHVRLGNTNRNTSEYKHSNERGGRMKRYVLSTSRWNKNIITYSIVKYPSRYNFKIASREIDDAIQKAFRIWEQQTSLKFQYQPNEIEVDIEISFASTYHGDSYPFDGPGKTLAHAFFPGSGIGGDVHFEEEEDWRLGTYSGIDLLYVAVHEIGHSLGLGHSSEYGAVMYPMYRGYFPNLQLHKDDIRGIQALYGVPDESTKTTLGTSPKTTPTLTTTTFRPFVNATTSKTMNPNPEANNNPLCENPKIDAIITIYGDAVLVFQGTRVYEIGKHGEGVLPGWPKEIPDYFKGLEEYLDCALTRLNGKTYFFKREKYWRFTGKQMDIGYPRLISKHFPGIPNDLDAAFEWDSEFVFVKGNKFWRFNTRNIPKVQSFFPMPTSHWGMNMGINAAFTAPNRSVYFFHDSHFWEFNKLSHRILRKTGETSLSSERWFGCSEP